MASGSALILFPIVWIAVGAFWAPVLVSERVRELFGTWPTTSLAANYSLAVLLVGFGHVAAFLAGGVALPAGDVRLLQYAVALNVAVPTLGWLAAIVIRPRVAGSTAAIRRAAFPLALGAVWYAVVTTGVLVVLVAVVIVVAAPFG